MGILRQINVRNNYNCEEWVAINRKYINNLITERIKNNVLKRTIIILPTFNSDLYCLII